MRDVEVWSILFGVPIAIASFWFWVGRVEKIKPRWVIASILYAVLYVSIFHFWLKAF